MLPAIHVMATYITSHDFLVILAYLSLLGPAFAFLLFVCFIQIDLHLLKKGRKPLFLLVSNEPAIQIGVSYDISAHNPAALDRYAQKAIRL